jgi:uncharacterized membrane protein YbhN (UPF0104 family)
VPSNRVFYLIKLALALGAVSYLAYLVEWGRMLKAASEAEPLWILAALALLPLNLFLEAYRWHRLVRQVAPGVRLTESIAAMLSGYPLGLATPGRVGDYFGRAYYLRHGNKWELAALTFAERTMTLACCIIFGTGALVYLLATRTELATPVWTAVLYLGILAAGALLALLLVPRAAHEMLLALIPSRKIRHMLSFLDRFSTRDAHTLFGLSALRYGVFSTQFYLLVLAFEPGMPLLAGMVGVAMVFFAKSAVPSLTLADLGIREGAAVFFFGMLGGDTAAAFNASLLLFCINIALPALIGLPFIMRLRLNGESAPAGQTAALARAETRRAAR